MTETPLTDTDLMITGGIVLLLIMLSALFSGSETALTATAKARIMAIAKSGSKRADRVLALIEDKERLIGAILLGNNLVNILATALTTSLFAGLFGPEGVIYATVVMTLLVLIFAEVLPKSYAISNPDRMALGVSPIIALVVTVFAPVVRIVQSIVRVTLRLFGVELTDSAHVLSPQEEIKGTIDMHSAEGGLDSDEKNMLGSILELETRPVYDVMVHRSAMQTVNINQDPDAFIDAVVKSPYTRLPVHDGNPENIIGIVHAKDVLRNLRHAAKGTNARARKLIPRRLVSKAWFVPETTTLREQLNAFLEKKAHIALVVDEYGDIQGLVTLEDILEEIVGDIRDEHDFIVPGVTESADGSIVVEGNVTVRDLNRQLDWDLPEDDAVTIAGLVIFQAGRLPIVGSRYKFLDYEAEVTGRKRNQVTEVRIVRG